MIKAVLFDMDGVLVDAKDWHYEALNKALALFGMAINQEEHHALYDGLPTRQKLKVLSKTKGLPEGLHDFINKMKQINTFDIINAKCRPLFHHQYALSRLKREGFRIAVCSNSIRSTVSLMLGRTALSPFIDFSLSNEDVTDAKPSPEIYIKAIERLGLSPLECLIVEDNVHGIAAARASGAHLLEVATVYDVTYDRILSAVRVAEA